MERALNPFGQLVDPEPRARATCPHCKGAMVSKCGDVLTWHWSHLGETCEAWTRASSSSSDTSSAAPARWVEVEVHEVGPRPPERTCYTCWRWQRRCTADDASTDAWLADHARPTPDGLARVYLDAPPCPAYVEAKRRSPYGALTLGQIIEPEHQERLRRMLEGVYTE